MEPSRTQYYRYFSHRNLTVWRNTFRLVFLYTFGRAPTSRIWRQCNHPIWRKNSVTNIEAKLVFIIYYGSLPSASDTCSNSEAVRDLDHFVDIRMGAFVLLVQTAMGFPHQLRQRLNASIGLGHFFELQYSQWLYRLYYGDIRKNRASHALFRCQLEC